MATQSDRPPGPLVDPDPKIGTVLREKWKRLNVRNEHWMLVIVGEEGIGKSHTALTIGALVDPDFSAKNVFFHPANVLKRLRDDEYTPGDVWVLDEAGVGLGSRTWYDSGQKKLNQALQLIRNHNLGLIFTLPALGGLDSQTQRRLQNALKIEHKRDGEFVRGEWYYSKVDRMDFAKASNDVWWEKPTINGSKLRTVAFEPPPEDVVTPYEKAKADFQAEFYDETIEELEDDEEEEEDELSVAEIVDQIKQTDEGVSPYLSWHGGHNKPVISKERLRESFNLSIRDSKHLKDRLVEDHTIDIEEAWERRQQDG